MYGSFNIEINNVDKVQMDDKGSIVYSTKGDKMLLISPLLQKEQIYKNI